MMKYKVTHLGKTMLSTDSLKVVANFCNNLSVNMVRILGNCDKNREWYSPIGYAFPNKYVIEEKGLAEDAFKSYLIFLRLDLESRYNPIKTREEYEEYNLEMDTLYFHGIDRGLKHKIVSILLGGWTPTQYLPRREVL